ncbi:hypothetical protein FO519_006045 [Halicephalobus sp. NKZ332]|nr:hypothetical protein FO519_006045 [Halicephalobus sp. NKZ332]
MSEQTGAATEGNVPTPATSTSTSSSEDKTSSNQVTTERTMPVNDPPVMGTSTQMPPLVVKQIGVQKPGVPPTAGSVSFDYSGPPVKVTNSTVLDLVNQFGIQNAWSAVLKLRGYNVTKEGGESILPIKRFRERVRKLKQTAETLKSRSDDSTTFLSKEFITSSNMNTESGQDVRNGPKAYSTTDAVIESILRQAVSENDNTQSGGPSTASASDAKAKRGRKKGKTETASKVAVPAASTSHQGRATSATIDDVVSSVVNKIRNNEPFDGDLNVNLPQASPHQQPQVVYASHIPGQTYVMIHDDQMIPVVPQTIAQPPAPATKPSRSRKKGKAAQQAQPPQVVQYSNYIPQPQAGPAIRTTTSSGNVPQHVTVVTVPRGQPGTAGPANYVVPSGYATANGNQPLIFSSNIDFIRNQASPSGQITKLVTYQPGVQFSQPFVANASPQGISPTTAYQAAPAHQPGQYILQSAPVPPPQPKPAPLPIATSIEAEDDRKKTPRRKSVKGKRDSMFMENFNESDFEELATPKRKESIKKANKKKESKSIEKKAGKPVIEKPAKKPVKETEKEKEKKKTAKKRKPSPVSVSEEEDADESDAGSSIIGTKGNKGDEVAQLKRQLQAERSRHYTQKRRATKLDDDYKRVLDRLQQTELNLALQMSECERLQGEMKKLRAENDDLSSQFEASGVAKSSNKPAKGVPKKAGPKRKVESPSPPPPTPTKKAPVKKAAPAKAPVNNKKRGRPSAPSPDIDESSPPVSTETKPTFNLEDLIPRRAAASKRIRYF